MYVAFGSLSPWLNILFLLKHFYFILHYSNAYIFPILKADQWQEFLSCPPSTQPNLWLSYSACRTGAFLTEVISFSKLLFSDQSKNKKDRIFSIIISSLLHNQNFHLWRTCILYVGFLMCISTKVWQETLTNVS